MNNPSRTSMILAVAVTVLSMHEAIGQRAPTPPRTTPPNSGSASTPTGGSRSVSHVVGRTTVGRPDTTGRCIATVGCPAPRAVPRCATMPRTLTINEIWAQRFQLQGRSVSIQTRLDGGASCTERACSNLCCNSCTGGHIGMENPSDTNAHVRLGDDNDPLLACSGDDSGLCCGTQIPSGAVVVTGTLVPVPNTGGDWRVENPTICSVP